MTDEGLKHLTGLAKLTTLRLQLTKVTAEGAKKLAAALPGCEVQSDHGTFSPQAKK